MRLIKKILIFSLTLLLGLVTVLPAYADAKSNKKQGGMDNSNVSEADMDQYIEELRDFVQVRGNGTIFLRKSYKNHVDIPEYVVNSIEDWFQVLNEEVNIGEIKITKDLEVLQANGVYQDPTEVEFSILSHNGVNGVKIYWWGYKLYLDNNRTRELRNVIIYGGGASALAAAWAPWFTPQTALVRAVLSSLTVISGSAAALLSANNNGRGVWIRFVGSYYSPQSPSSIYTGMGPQ